MTAMTAQVRADLSEKLAEARAVGQRAREDNDYVIARWYEAKAACLALVLRDAENEVAQ
jgi:Arc/MetJ family transcription regulator